MKQPSAKQKPVAPKKPDPNRPGGDRDSSLNGTLKRGDNNKGGGNKLGQILLKEGLITQTQLEEALKIQEKVNTRLGRVLVKLGYVENKTISECLARQLNLPVVNIKDHEIPEKVGKDQACKHGPRLAQLSRAWSLSGCNTRMRVRFTCTMP